MIIFLDARGNIITPSAPEPIGRNSNDAGVIYVVAPISQAANIYMTFTLPNGEPLFGDVLEKVSKGEEVGDDVHASYAFTLPDGALSVWRYRVPASVTRLAGVVQYTIVTVTDSMRATASGTFTVSRGTRLTPPEDPTPDAWNRVLEALGYKNSDIDQLLEEIYGVGGTFGDTKEGGILDRVQKVEEKAETNSNDIADLQQRASNLEEVDRAIIGEVPSLELGGVRTPLSVVLAKAQKYWIDQEPQVVVSGPAKFRVFEDGVFRDVELDAPPYTRISFDLGVNVPRGTAYMVGRTVEFEVVGDISDNTIKIVRDASLEDVAKKVSDHRGELDFLDENAATGLSVELSDEDYTFSIILKNRYGDILYKKVVDFPLEAAFIAAELSEDGRELTFKLQSGNTVTIETDKLVGWETALQSYQKKPQEGTHFVTSTEFATKDTAGIVRANPENGLQCDNGDLKLSFFSVVDGALCLNFEEET